MAGLFVSSLVLNVLLSLSIRLDARGPNMPSSPAINCVARYLHHVLLENVVLFTIKTITVASTDMPSDLRVSPSPLQLEPQVQGLTRPLIIWKQVSSSPESGPTPSFQ